MSARPAGSLPPLLMPFESRLARYGSAVVMTALALILQLQLWPHIAPTPFLLFFGVVAFCAWYGGFGPALMAIALSEGVVTWFFLPPFSVLGLRSPTERAVLGVFSAVSLGIAVLVSRARRGYQQVREAGRAAEAERQRLGALFEHAPALISIVRGPEHRFELINKAAREIMGEPPALGDPLRAHLPPEAKALSEAFDRVYSTGRSEQLQGLALTRTWAGRTAPETRYFQVALEPSRGADGSAQGVLSMAFDVTEQVQASRAKDEFLSVAAHELRTPVAALLLQAQLLARRLALGQPQSAPTALALERQARRLAGLVDALLDVSRAAAGQQFEVQRESVDLRELCREVLERLGPSLERAGCAVSLHAPAPVAGGWDRQRLEQVITNLLSNAQKYASGASVRVEVLDEGERAVLRVRDDGPGIEPEDLERIFRRFERGAPGNGAAGLGLGLWLARLLVEAHGGTLTAESERGKGAAFTVRLPK